MSTPEWNEQARVRLASRYGPEGQAALAEIDRLTAEVERLMKDAQLNTARAEEWIGLRAMRERAEAAEARIRDLEGEIDRLTAELAEWEAENAPVQAYERLAHRRLMEAKAATERAEAAEASLVFEREYREEAVRDRDDAEAKLAEAQRDIAGYQQDLENARDSGAKTMIDQMERAITSGGKFSDERANAFVTARSVGWAPKQSTIEAELAAARAQCDKLQAELDARK